MFDEFVLDAISNGKTQFDYGTCERAQQLLIQLNLSIDSVIETHGVDAAGNAVWYAYGCTSCTVRDALDESVEEGFAEFYESMKSLYGNGFAKHCVNSPTPFESSGRLDSACYMLWDMDGLEYRTFFQSPRVMHLAEPLIDFGMAHHHSAVQVSFLHCLGHQLNRVPDFAGPKLARFLRRTDLFQDVREYAQKCQTGMIL